MFGFGETITVLRSPQGRGRDRYGDRAKDVSHTIDGVGIWYADSTQLPAGEGQVENRVAIATDVQLFLPVGADLLPTDFVELPDGETFKVSGRILPQKNPITGSYPGKLANLVQIKG